MTTPVSIQSVCKTYGKHVALDSIDLDIAAGEFLTLLGPSGSGKTTLLQVLAGFVTATSGSIMAGREELLTCPPHRRNIGMVFQNYALFPHMNVFDNVAYPLKLRRVGKVDIEARVRKALQTVRMGEFVDRGVDRLSGGQRQRVALARAIVFEPKILLMDESLSALDKKLREQMQIELRELHERLGTTTIFVTHDQREALTMSDRVALINKGALVQVDGPRDIYERPRTKFVADFIGETTFLPIDIAAGGAANLFGKPLRMREPPRQDGGRHWLAIRPEKIALDTGSPGDPDVNEFEAVAREIIFQGDSARLLAHLPDGQDVAVRLTLLGTSRLPDPGAAIRLRLHRNDTIAVGDD